MDFSNIISGIVKILSNETFIAAITAAIFGAAIAGYFSFLAIKKAHKYNMEKADLEVRTVTSNTLRLIMIEIKTAWEVYDAEYAKDLNTLAEGEPYIATFPVGANTFSLYDSSPSCLANLPIDLAEKIVLIYMRMKGLIAMIELNNSDARQVYSSTEINVQAICNERVASGRPLTGEELEKVFNTHLNHEAVRLGMGSTANGMKLLGAEIKDLYIALSNSCSIE
ncbi:hypothetical protein [Pseudomonas proteolytica]|uniref:hypothetical protein n=1 Tax=Pseudomonas proteolytica TaxID=219574 RepID=UPI0014738B09|nr:hypothetical protein [Pseudomonas proteolytica]NMZ34066.1 hypothetical protein [Pseudomonas proteolytica]